MLCTVLFELDFDTMDSCDLEPAKLIYNPNKKRGHKTLLWDFSQHSGFYKSGTSYPMDFYIF